MAKTDELGKRMKQYEYVTRTYLTRRTPVIIRVDMRAGHSFCKKFARPFDEIFIRSMQETAKYLCENIEGVTMSYQQSDEITLVLNDYKKLNTQAWFDYNIQKCVSIAASMATIAFDRIFWDIINSLDPLTCFYDEESDFKTAESFGFSREYIKTEEFDALFRENYIPTIYNKYPTFDARIFNIPKEEVCNNLIWRQMDATRNSIQMVGQANFTHKELQNKSCNQIQEMLFLQKGINWYNLPTYQKRGSCCIKEDYVIHVENGDGVTRTRWIVDKDIPIFTKNREYVESRALHIDEE